MPFAEKFRAMLALPLAGDTLGDAADGLTVESIAVGHEGRAAGLYAYPLRLVLRGPGGLTAVKRAIKALFARRCTTFSGYGHAYQLWLGQPTIGRWAAAAMRSPPKAPARACIWNKKTCCVLPSTWLAKGCWPPRGMSAPRGGRLPGQLSRRGAAPGGPLQDRLRRSEAG